MSYKSPYKKFIFEEYSFDADSLTLSMSYSYDGERRFTEKVVYQNAVSGFDEEVVLRLCEYTFLVAGTSYYKLFPTKEFDLGDIKLGASAVELLNKLYTGGLSQFIYENDLDPADMAQFSASEQEAQKPLEYGGNGLLLMQSGGKDSLLATELLKDAGHDFEMTHISSTGEYPPFLDMIDAKMNAAQRIIDLPAIKQGIADGGLNGHIPFSALYGGFALIQAVLLNKSLAISSIETAAEEPSLITESGFEVNHQYSKRYEIELGLQKYLHDRVATGVNYGSILRPLSEVKIGELFARFAWKKYKDHFSSCNNANYRQGEDKGSLSWDGTCPKCANSFLLFAPFVDKAELLEVFSGKNIIRSEDMQSTYRDLLGVSDAKPLECVGTIDEMRYAYKAANAKDSEYSLSFDVPDTDFDKDELHVHQALFDELIDYSSL